MGLPTFPVDVARIGMICCWYIISVVPTSALIGFLVDVEIAIFVTVAELEKPKSILTIESHKRSMLTQKASACAIAQKYYTIIGGLDGNKLSIESFWLNVDKED